MGENNYTSLAQELVNQEESENQKMFTVYFDDTEPPKDYVIDQIFYGENIMIYELIEISDVTNWTSDKQLVEVTNSDINNDFRFYQRNFCKKTTDEECMKDLTVIYPDEDIDLMLSNDHRKESVYCLKPFGSSNDLSNRAEKGTSLKALCNNDMILKNHNPTNFKTVSKGVNTDTAHCPKLLEELSLNFLQPKSELQVLDKISLNSCNVSYEEVDISPGLPSLNSEFNAKKQKKLSPNYILVPFFLLEEDMLNRLLKDGKGQCFSEEKLSFLRTAITIKKTSIGINTDVTELEFGTPKIEDDAKEKKALIKNVKMCDCQILSEKEESSKVDETKEGNKVHSKSTTKETILDEIRNLQCKLNSLVKSLESNDYNFSPKNPLDERKSLEVLAHLTSPEENTNIEQRPDLDMEPELLVLETEPVLKNYKRYDDLPIFSPLHYLPPTNKVSKNRNRHQNTDRGDKKGMSISVTKSETSTNSTLTIESPLIAQNICQHGKPEPDLNDNLKESSTNWRGVNWKSIGVSKSEANHRCISLDKYNFIHDLKKSISLDLGEARLDTVGLKKIKNTFKLEGNSNTKSNIRVHQNGENPLGNNLTSLKCEMGDEASKTSKFTLTSLVKTTEKKEKTFNQIKKDGFDIKNIEKGDAKISYQKHNLSTPKYFQNTGKLTVHYCTTNTTVSDGLLKSHKTYTLNKGKFKNNEKLSERSLKINSDPEKLPTPVRNLRKPNISDIHGKKGIKANNQNKAVQKPIKFEKKVSIQDTPEKQKTAFVSRKSNVKDFAESKLHIDKFIRRRDESKTECSQSPNQYSQLKLRHNEKYIGKGEQMSRLSLPTSQKQECRELTSSRQLVDSHKKTTNSFRKKSVILVRVESNPEMKKTSDKDEKENVENIMVFENKVENSTKIILSENDQSTSNPSSVVLELFSKKSTFVDKFCSEVDQECKYAGENIINSINNKKSTMKNDESKVLKDNYGNPDKTIVTSVWALTKVLLYEDGTKKFEVLEASLTPPGYCLKNEKNDR